MGQTTRRSRRRTWSGAAWLTLATLHLPAVAASAEPQARSTTAPLPSPCFLWRFIPADGAGEASEQRLSGFSQQAVSLNGADGGEARSAPDRRSASRGARPGDVWLARVTVC